MNAPFHAADEAAAPRRPRVRLPGRPVQRVVAAGVVLGVLALGAGVALYQRQAAAARASDAQQSMVIQPRPFAATISVVGAIAPADTIGVTAPLDGRVTRIGFEYGAPVRQGQFLVEFDVSTVRQQRDQALSSFLKASQAAADMANWASGPDASHARRAVTAADAALRETQRKAQETKSLLDKGLVARSEYDGLVSQQRTQQMDLDAAQQDLDTTLRRGEGINREASSVDLQAAHAHLAELDAELAGAVVRSPADGVIARPPADKAGDEGAIHVGQSLARGQFIGDVARAGAFSVTFRLGEADADRVRPGQAVTVTGPGFGGALQGHVTSVGGEAVQTASAGSLASFAADAVLDGLTPAQAAALRIGMTANVVIAVYSTPSAIVVPPAAIIGAAPAATVMVRDRATGRVVPAAVRLGQAAPDGVEVLSGLKAGDVVVWSPPAAPAS